MQAVTYPVKDIKAAKKWYAKVLHRKPVSESDHTASFLIDDIMLTLDAAHSATSDGSNAIVFWKVNNVLRSYLSLVAEGAVLFEEFSIEGNTRIAKLRDPFGNIIGITDTVSHGNVSLDEHPSETALTVTLYRALAASDDRLAIRGPDHLARIFLTADGLHKLQNEQDRQKIFTGPFTSRVYAFVTARTAFIDEIVNRALDGKIPQIVLLGAGYDTRALRFADKMPNTRVFELDIPTTQQRKIAMLKQANISIPEQLIFVPVNFNKQLPEDVLMPAGFDKSKRTLFIWEGVIYYLPEISAKQTLRSIKNLAAGGSSICLDYLTHPLPAVSASESFNFWRDTDSFKTLLSDHSILITEHFSKEEIEQKYLRPWTGESLKFFAFVHGLINKS